MGKEEVQRFKAWQEPVFLLACLCSQRLHGSVLSLAGRLHTVPKVMSKSLNTKSRVTGDCHARFCERLKVRFLRPTRQYFLGLEEYTYKDVFDRSLFTTLRYRLGADKFDAMTSEIILTSEGKGKRDVNDAGESSSSGKLQQDSSITADNQSEEKPKGNKGALIGRCDSG